MVCLLACLRAVGECGDSPCPPKDQLQCTSLRTLSTGGSMKAVGEAHAVLDDEKPAHGNVVPMKLAHNKIRVRPSRWHCHCCCVVLDGTGTVCFQIIGNLETMHD